MPEHEVSGAYSRRAHEYAAALGRISATLPVDRDTIAAWALACVGPVIDLGCGPGHWTAYLDEIGVEVSGVDPSRAFIEIALDAHPNVSFTVGTAADLHPGGAAGVLAWYSLIHVPPERLGGELAAVRRLLGPAGRLLVGFFTGDEVAPFDHAVTTAWTWTPEWIARRLVEAGLIVEQVRRREDPGAREHGEVWAVLPAEEDCAGPEQRVPDVVGGPGWVLSGESLDPVITDLPAFRAGLAPDPLASAIEALWTGHVDEARAVLRATPPSVRTRALLADCDRRAGDAWTAVAALRALVAEHEEDRWAPVLRQHLGKALLAEGEVDAARRELRLALEARLVSGADEGLLASSRQALARTGLGVGPRTPTGPAGTGD